MAVWKNCLPVKIQLMFDSSYIDKVKCHKKQERKKINQNTGENTQIYA